MDYSWKMTLRLVGIVLILVGFFQIKNGYTSTYYLKILKEGEKRFQLEVPPSGIWPTGIYLAKGQAFTVHTPGRVAEYNVWVAGQSFYPHVENGRLWVRGTTEQEGELKVYYSEFSPGPITLILELQ